MKYGLSDEQLKQILDIIASYDEIEEAILFGSRAIDTYKEASDVDIAIKGKRVTASLAAKLKYRFEEDTYLPFFFDFIAYPTITNESLMKHIDTKGVPIYRAGWKKCKIIDVISLEYGKGLNDYREGIGKYDVFGTNGRIGVTEQFLYDQQSIVIGRKGAYREVHLAKKPFFVIDTAFYTKKKTDDIDTLFLYYWFKGIDINQMDSGSAIPSTSRDEVYDLDILLPPLPEQKAIASVLSSLDDKIDLLHRQNKTLEAMAETLFRQWFVEEANWDGALSEYIKVQGGYAFKSPDFKETGNNGIIKITNISFGSIDTINTQFVDDAIVESLDASKFKIRSGDFLIAMTGAEIGKIGIIEKTERSFWLNQRVGKLIPNVVYGEYIGYLALKSPEGQDHIINACSGSAQENISSTKLEEMKFISYSKQKTDLFGQEAKPLFDKIIFNQSEIHTLEKLRDTLLPKLMSGEIRVEHDAN